MLVLEDLRWAEEPLLEFLEYLVDWAREVPLFLLCIARPELYERRPSVASSHIDSIPITTRRTMMAGKIEIRKSGEKFRFIVLNRSGEKLLQSGQFDDKPSTRRAVSSLAKAVSGAEIVDATKPAALRRRAARVARS